MTEATTIADRQRATAVLVEIAEDHQVLDELRVQAAQSVLHAPWTGISDPTIDDLAEKISERLADRAEP